MKHWFSKLKWRRFDDESYFHFTELDTYADFVFDNGIAIRICTGQMANTTPQHKYEMNIRHKNGNRLQKCELNEFDIQLIMEDLNNLNTEE